MLYDIHFRRDAHTAKDFSLVERGLYTLESARDARCMSGDLVVFHNTLIVVNEPDWLWGWERLNPDCYARRAMNSGKTFAEMVRFLAALG